VLSPPEPVKDGSRGSQVPPAHGIEHGKEPPDLAHSASAISSSLGKDSSGQFSPAVRGLAREHGVDLEGIAGSGLGGRVTKKDVQRAIDEKRVGSPTRPTPQPILEDHAVPLTRVRKLIAENVTRSKATIPHAWQTQEVDMSGVVANRAANKGRFQQLEGYSLTYLPYVIKATASALRKHPAVNSTCNEAELIIHGQVNIGISVGLESSVITPVLRQADQLTVAGIARAVGDFAQRAREGKVSADELQGATFTVNNSGTFGTLFSYSVIVPGQAGILTMEAIVERPVAVGGMIAVKPMMYLCFSLDHRVMDGLAAARFLSSCRQWLEAVAEDISIW